MTDGYITQAGKVLCSLRTWLEVLGGLLCLRSKVGGSPGVVCDGTLKLFSLRKNDLVASMGSLAQQKTSGGGQGGAGDKTCDCCWTVIDMAVYQEALESHPHIQDFLIKMVKLRQIARLWLEILRGGRVPS